MKRLLLLSALFSSCLITTAQSDLQPTKHFTGENTLSMTGISANGEPAAPEAMKISIDDNEIESIRIFPNNTEAEIICVFPQTTNLDVIVWNSKGDVVEQLKGFDAKSFYINILEYQTGLYTIRITDNEQKQKCLINAQKIY